MTAPVETPLITYNLKDRKRKFRGKDRSYQKASPMKRLIAAINSPATQERVRHGDMHGYYGHTFRAHFGLIPPESVIADGKVVMIEPAFVTTHLKAHDDGTVEHKARFLDNAPGRIAAGLFHNKTGGWSSAIDEEKPEFCGFDFVAEPNFSSNRGYDLTFDSAAGETAGRVLDAVLVSEYNGQLRGALKLLDSITHAHDNALLVIEQLQAEREELLSLLASRNGTGTLDAAPTLPISVSRDAAHRFERDCEQFKDAYLPRISEPMEQRPENPKQSRFLDRLLGRY